MSAARAPAEIAGAASGETASRRLGGPRPTDLVPADTVAGRSLVAVVAILTFMAALSAVGADLVARSSADWKGTVAREATLQVRPVGGRDLDGDVARAVGIARATSGVTGADPYSAADAAAMLEPWLGRGLDLGDLPVPRIVALRLDADHPADLADLGRRLAAEIPGALVDDHGGWLRRLSAMADAVVGAALALVGLVALATGLAVVFATRGAMAGARDVVDVLHIVGADERFIVRQFSRRFLRLGLEGGLLGGVAAAALVGATAWLSGGAPTTAAGYEVAAMFGTVGIGWRAYAGMLAVVLVVAAVARGVSARTVRRLLAER